MFLLDRLHAKLKTPSADQALPGRDNEVDPGANHFVNGRALKPPFPDHLEQLVHKHAWLKPFSQSLLQVTMELASSVYCRIRNLPLSDQDIVE